ncbi:Tyrosinase-like protein orsC [Apiospora arundinis]
MRLIHFALCVLLALAHVGFAASRPLGGTNVTNDTGCQHPLIRKEWRTLSTFERQRFIRAVRCHQTAPGQTSDVFYGVRSRYDDFLALHISQTDYVHWVGQLLPWHRYLLWSFEQSLRETCDYNGTVPYWDWTQDAVSEKAFLESPIFDPIHGFGGNGPYIANTAGFPIDWQHPMTDVPGRTGGGCIQDGPFAQVNVSMGPGNHTDYTPHCLRRDFSPSLITQALNASKLAFVLDAEDFWHLDHRIEGLSLGIADMSLHGGAHLGVGGNIGELSNTYSSPADPIFWLHHAALDRVWNVWQNQDWETRKSDIGGPDTQWAYPYNYFGDKPYKNVTLETPLHFGQIGGL